MRDKNGKIINDLLPPHPNPAPPPLTPFQLRVKNLLREQTKSTIIAAINKIENEFCDNSTTKERRLEIAQFLTRAENKTMSLSLLHDVLEFASTIQLPTKWVKIIGDENLDDNMPNIPSWMESDD